MFVDCLSFLQKKIERQLVGKDTWRPGVCNTTWQIDPLTYIVPFRN